MSAKDVSFAVPCEAIRVFWGFPSSKLTQDQFFTQLGRTFMPGTVYMLQPLGLAGYLPGVLASPAPGLPHEFALICYASANAYTQTNVNTLRGRVYSQTHGGVYDSPPSGAAFPIFVDDLPPTDVDPYYLVRAPIDWQTGVTNVGVAAKKNASQPGKDFRLALRSAWLVQRAKLLDAGIDQVIVVATDVYTLMWLHGSTPDLPISLDFLNDVIAAPVVQRNERVICVDEPPVVTIAGNSAFNFIFVREEKYFLI
jgi:hypothetical protein